MPRNARNWGLGVSRYLRMRPGGTWAMEPSLRLFPTALCQGHGNFSTVTHPGVGLFVTVNFGTRLTCREFLSVCSSGLSVCPNLIFLSELREHIAITFVPS